MYYTKGSCSLATRIVINELGLSCEYESVDLASKKSETGKNYDTINPKCVVPALLLNNGEILTENAVIMQYLADTSHATQLLPREGDLNRYRVRVVEFCGDGATQRTGVFIQSSSISRNKR